MKETETDNQSKTQSQTPIADVILPTGSYMLWKWC